MGVGSLARHVWRLRRLLDLGYAPTLARHIVALPRLYDRGFVPIYVCGVAGSGNTLLAGLLHQHYRTAGFVRESALSMPSGAPLRIEKVATFGSLASFRAALELPGTASIARVRASSHALYRSVADYPKISRLVVDKGPNVHMVRSRWLHAAFPDARFVMVYRDPVANVEGLRRKWPEVFGRAALEEVCAFWTDLHERFLADTRPFAGAVRILSYQDLVDAPERRLREVARFCGLRRRARPMALEDRPNRPGPALRNVVGGRIHVVTDADEQARRRLSSEERDVIASRTAALYASLRHMEEKRGQ
jgi:hypothetical protein